jgi:hypothetical protein
MQFHCSQQHLVFFLVAVVFTFFDPSFKNKLVVKYYNPISSKCKYNYYNTNNFFRETYHCGKGDSSNKSLGCKLSPRDYWLVTKKVIEWYSRHSINNCRENSLLTIVNFNQPYMVSYT